MVCASGLAEERQYLIPGDACDGRSSVSLVFKALGATWCLTCCPAMTMRKANTQLGYCSLQAAPAQFSWNPTIGKRLALCCSEFHCATNDGDGA